MSETSDRPTFAAELEELIDSSGASEEEIMQALMMRLVMRCLAVKKPDRRAAAESLAAILVKTVDVSNALSGDIHQ